jgi:NAD-dependent SIR2 family protein deacetylase
MDKEARFALAASWIRDADGLLITAGAGNGVDSGLPDFRGDTGFWHAYPPLRDAGLSFHDMANPAGFVQHPRLSWGFYGHRLALYRDTVPHEGYGRLLDWASKMTHGAFVFTSNVDGQFQKAGFDPARVVECHGSIHAMQCMEPCGFRYWSADQFVPDVDIARCELRNALPTCPHCGGMARPNILMFNDWHWVNAAAEQQHAALMQWLNDVKKLVVIELGAGTAVPTVRHFSERMGQRIIRINPREFAIAPSLGIGIQQSALAGLQLLDAQIKLSE